MNEWNNLDNDGIESETVTYQFKNRLDKYMKARRVTHILALHFLVKCRLSFRQFPIKTIINLPGNFQKLFYKKFPTSTDLPNNDRAFVLHRCSQLLKGFSIIFNHLMPNTHRRRRRDETVLSRRRRRCVHEFANSWRQFRRVVGVNTPVGDQVAKLSQFDPNFNVLGLSKNKKPTTCAKQKSLCSALISILVNLSS